VLIGIVWALGAIGAYSLKRQFRNFCSEVLTLAFHFYVSDVSLSGQRNQVVPAETLLGPNARITS
jgi:hypothetical protein